MKHSKLSDPSYFMVDTGMGQITERDFRSCSHCQAMVILNKQRTRPQGYCSKCDRYLCDNCEGIRAATGECRPAVQQIDEIVEKAIQDTMIKEI